MAQEFAFAAPRAEEMTKTVVGMGVGMVTGLAEGVIISMAPALGAMAPLVSWGALLGVPLVGAAGALFTKGMIGDVFQGVAAGGAAILGYSLPALMKPYLPTGGQGARQLSGQGAVKLLPAGATYAPQRAQERASHALGSWASTPEEDRGVVGQGHTVRDLS